MGYSKEVYQKAMAVLQERQTTAQLESDQRREQFFAICPRGREIEHQLAGTAITAAKIVLKRGGDTAETLRQLRAQNQQLQGELRELLRENGLQPEDLQPQYTCPSCRDTGYRDGVMCGCLKQLLRTEACRQMNRETPLELCTFESFRLDYYPETLEGTQLKPRKHMQQVFQFCRQYAEQFSREARSLLFVGGTGLSKTHLSLAIANVVLQKGYGVVYDSVHNFMNTLERERFGRESDGGEDTEHLLQTCDLLILDDLGTEFRTQFTTATIYNLVNTRLMANRPTIISTNLSLEEMEQYYTRRFVSRVSSSYVKLPFQGRDIRQIKATERMKKQTP